MSTFKEIRMSKGITIAHIARLLNVTQTSIRNKESGKSEFTLSEARALANLYNVSLDKVIM